MEAKELLQAELKKIEKWEKDQKGTWFWQRIGRLPFKLLDKLTPAFIQNKIGALLDELGSYIQTGGKYLTKEQKILDQLQEIVPGNAPLTIQDASRLPLEAMDEVSERIGKTNSNYATVQGATTGFGGIFTLAADIPAILGLSLKTLQDIAVAYGFDPNDREERVFIVKCLQFSSADTVGKEAILNSMNAGHGAGQRKEMISQLQGWREVIYTYRDQFGLKKLLQMVPVAGMVFGAFTNRSMIGDIAETGRMLYRKRRIMERLQLQSGPDLSPSEAISRFHPEKG